MNDNPPIFNQPVYDVFLTDLAARGQFVTIVTASDADDISAGSDEAGTSGLRYSIVGGNEERGGTFEMESETGVVRLSALRTPELESNYLLNVSVTDGVFTNFARYEPIAENMRLSFPFMLSAVKSKFV